ncbi:MAG: ParB/RepB/Spo0J family partition protein [Thermodesulfovibrionia bacterium]|nr:ParB/RepB/Spo0J family partition protein [Thermodesulfovibrionia bacterium]
MKNDRELPINKVFPNPNQPRKEFDQEKLEGLAMNIKEYGVLQAIVTTPRTDPLHGEGFMIIAGERRYRASLLAGLKTIPSKVIEADDALVEELALLENIQRQDLNIIEEAKAFEALLKRKGWNKEKLAKKMGFKQVWRVDERLSLLKLTGEHQDMVIKGEITPSQAFEMSRVSSEKQELILRKIRAGGLDSYNRLRSFVEGLIDMDNQAKMFELTSLSSEEKKSIDDFRGLISNIERAIGTLQVKHLKKLSLHSDISAERIDLIISSLMKIRKSVLAGEGFKKAMEEAA